MQRLLTGFLARLDPAPVRVWSLIVTIYGDCAMPRGGSLWLGTLTELLHPFGVEPGSVRAAASRLARDGFLLRTRSGRTSRYALSPEALRLSRAAERVIYRTFAPQGEPGWDVAVPRGGGDRKRLAELGYGALVPGVFVRPRTEPELRHSGAIHLRAEGDDAALAAALYPLAEIAERYRAFTANVAPVAAAAVNASASDAVGLRIALVHAFRRVALRDPHLAPAALPPEWPADAAYAAFAAAYRALQPHSDAWLSRHAAIDGAAVTPEDVSRRFVDVASPDM